LSDGEQVVIGGIMQHIGAGWCIQATRRARCRVTACADVQEIASPDSGDGEGAKVIR